MAKKKKALDAAVLEELEKMVFQNFTAAANSISQLYAAAEEQRRITFHAGEQHGLEKVRQWVITRQGEGLPVTEVDIITYLQNELGYPTGDALMLPPSQPNQASSFNTQTTPSCTSTQDLQIPEGAKQMIGFASAPTSPTVGSSSLNRAQKGFLGEGNAQVPHIESIEMPAGSCLPHALPQLEHLDEEEDLSDSLDSPMDMNMDEHPSQHFP